MNQASLKIQERSLAKNSFGSILAQVMPMFIGFFALPVLVRELDLERFALMSLVWTIFGYFALSDLGLGRVIVKLVAERVGSEKETEVSKIVSTGLITMAGLGFLSSILLYFISTYLVRDVYTISEHLQAEAQLSFQILSTTILPVVLTSGLRGVLEARQDFRFINYLQAIVGSITYIGPFGILFYTKDMSAIVAILCAARWTSLFIHFYYSKKTLPNYFKKFEFEFDLIPRLFHFGTWLTLSSLIIGLKVYLDRFILSSIVPISTIAYYITPTEILSRILFIPGAIVRVIFPAFANLNAQNQSDLKKIYEISTKTIGFSIFTISLFLIFFAEEILSIWLGYAFGQNSSAIMQILALGTLINSLAWMPFVYIQSVERPDLATKFHLIELVVYACGLWFASREYGLVGAAWMRVFIETFDLLGILYIFRRLFAHKESVYRPVILVLLPAFLYLIPILFTLTIAAKVVLFFLILLVYSFYFWGYALNIDDRLSIIKSHPRLALDNYPTPALSTKRGAVIVTYNPAPDTVSNIHLIAKEFDSVVVIDNASQNLDRVKSILNSDFKNIHIIYNEKNFGLASALNQGVKYFVDLKYDWISTFDQDTKIRPGFLEQLSEVYTVVSKKRKVGVLTPTLIEQTAGYPLFPRKSKVSNYEFISLAITSGNLIRADVFNDIGYYDSQLFIDYVDHDFCFRIKKEGYEIVEAKEVSVMHGFGDPEWRKIGPVLFMITHHNAIRRYYITRNRLIMYKRYWWVDPNWIVEDFLRFNKEFIKMIFFEENKIEKIKSILAGLIDSIVGYVGPKRKGS